MKIWLILWISVSCLSVWAEDLTAKDGTVYRNVRIISVSPERMLIVHDGGGCQVEFNDLSSALSVEQRKTVENELRYYVERTQRLEKVRAEREVFEMAQREKGLIEFEGGWVSLMEREEIVLNRAERKVELDRKRLLLAQEQAAFEKEQLQTEKARYLLEGEPQGTTTITYGYYTPYRRDCIYPVPYRHKNDCSKPGANHSSIRSDCNDRVIYKSQNNPYITFEHVDAYNRGPFHR